VVRRARPREREGEALAERWRRNTARPADTNHDRFNNAEWRQRNEGFRLLARAYEATGDATLGEALAILLALRLEKRVGWEKRLKFLRRERDDLLSLVPQRVDAELQRQKQDGARRDNITRACEEVAASLGLEAASFSAAAARAEIIYRAYRHRLKASLSTKSWLQARTREGVVEDPRTKVSVGRNGGRVPNDPFWRAMIAAGAIVPE
jgi:hypothetical protein